MPRLPYLNKEDIAPEFQDIVARNTSVHRVLVNSPRTARQSGVLGRYLRYDCSLDARLRELAILQVTYSMGSEYEYSHHLKIAEDFGVPKADLLAIADETGGRPTHLEPIARAVLKAAREMVVEKVSDETFAELKAGLSPEHIVDVIYAIGFYCGFARITGSLEIDVEPEYLPYLEQYPLQDA